MTMEPAGQRWWSYVHDKINYATGFLFVSDPNPIFQH